MGTRTLEASLTLRLLALGGVTLLAVGLAAVLVTDRVLDSSDTTTARAEASAAREALERELAEGDPEPEALNEVAAAAEAEGLRLIARTRGRVVATAGSERLEALATGACATIDDEHGRPWRACSSAGADTTVTAAVAIGSHRAAVRALARGMTAVVVIGMVAFWLAVRRALRGPIAELTSLVGWTADIVASERSVAPPPTRTHEVARLEWAFDALVRRLLDSLARARANSAHIAHELRTPLTSILAELDHLKDHNGAAVARLRGDVARCADVIDAVLVLADPTGGARGNTVVNVADLARDVAPAGALVQAPDEALIEADERLVSLALRNLVDNADKYGGGARLLRVTREGSAVRLAVRDEGPGLEARALERMFERYWRAAPDGEGRGLGLALVRAVAERYGGSVEASSGGTGPGLEVSMIFGRVVGWHDGQALPR